jgi:hypothetical protein
MPPSWTQASTTSSTKAKSNHSWTGFLNYWPQPAVRNLYAASLFIVGLELVGPLFLLPVLATAPDSLVRVLGPVLRLVPIALASIIALAAFHSNRTKGEIA